MEQDRTIFDAIAEAEEEQGEAACEHCGGTGEVSVMGYVYPGEPHMADVDTRPCICRMRDEDDEIDLLFLE